MYIYQPSVLVRLVMNSLERFNSLNIDLNIITYNNLTKFQLEHITKTDPSYKEHISKYITFPIKIINILKQLN